ncbi:recombinase family protein [Sphingobium yanoikuyae]|uniref:recombinase family protein n=1 Tax=Sphingobium yanoikuyae TaxID=13690 RepID=UPI0008473690|nr:recombinase family protein [Sphingobium yanoikuyae]
MMSARLIGYARASVIGPALAEQEKQLRNGGCSEIFRDEATGVGAPRTQRFPSRSAAIDTLNAGDTFVVCRFDLLGRSTADIVATIWSILCLDCGFRSLNEGISFEARDTMDGRDIISAIAQATKALDAEITAENQSSRRAPRVVRRTLDDKDWPKIAKMLENMSVSAAARELGVSRPTLYRIMKRMS